MPVIKLQRANHGTRPAGFWPVHKLHQESCEESDQRTEELLHQGEELGQRSQRGSSVLGDAQRWILIFLAPVSRMSRFATRFCCCVFLSFLRSTQEPPHLSLTSASRSQTGLKLVPRLDWTQNSSLFWTLLVPIEGS